MPHPLVDQFRFTRSEWLRGLEGVSEEDAVQHFGPMNCISWTVGHLAWHEQRTFLQRPQGRVLAPRLIKEFAYGAPMSSPSLKEMLDAWRTVTQAADPFLESLTTQTLQNDLPLDGKSVGQSLGSALRRVTLPLLVSHRGDPGDPPDAWAEKSAGICRRDRSGSAVQTRMRMNANQEGKGGESNAPSWK